MSYEGSTGGSTRTITAFFDSRTDADEAVEALVNAGVSRSQVKVVAGREGGTSGSSSSSYSSSSSSSSYSSSNEGGFWDSLKDLFLPDEDRHTYAEGLNRGGYLVTARVSDAHYETALDILDDEGTIDMNERESSWRSEGWSGYTGGSAGSGLTGMARGGSLESGGLATGSGGMASGSTSMGSTSMGSSASVGNEEVIPVAEEELRIGKRDVSHGRVRVRSYVVETPVSEQVSLREENVHIERRPADRALSGNEQLFQDRTIDLEERSEEAVVSKDARVREELVISKDVNQRTETVSDTVRRTEVEVDDERATGTGTGTGLGTDRTR